jgi:DNA phosphorothioation-dependent restriction protein DptG
MGNLSVGTKKLDGFFKHALLPSKTSITSGSSVVLKFLNKGSTVIFHQHYLEHK